MLLLASLLAAAAAVASVRVPPRLARPAREQLARHEPEVAWMPWAAGAASALASVLLVGGPAGVVIGAAVAGLVWWRVRRMEPPALRRRREELERRLPHAVDLLAACLAAGQAPAVAVAAVAPAVGGPLGQELARVSARLELGADPVAVWRDLRAHPQLAPLGRCVARAVDQGASVSEAMSRLAEDLRRDQRARVEAEARAVGVKAAVPLGVCLLPAFVLVAVVPLVAGSLSGLLR